MVEIIFFSNKIDENKSRFHIIFTLKYFKYVLIFSVVSFLQALIRFTAASFFIAFFTSAFLFLACFVAAFVMWYFTSFSIEKGIITVKRGLVFKCESVYIKNSIAALDIERNLFHRILGASVLTVYFKNNFLPRKVKFYLPKKAALKAANTLMPVKEKNAAFEPAGVQRVILVLLSANIISTGAFIYVSLDYIGNLLGQSPLELAMLARDNIVSISTMVKNIIPAGVVIILTLVFFIASLTVLLSFFRTAGLRVCRAGGVILCKGGLITKTERRINTNCILACDVKVTPIARLIGRKALYITAGSYKSSDYPLLVYKKEHEDRPKILLSEFSLPSEKLCDYKRKSIFQYVYKQMFCLFLCAIAFAVLSYMQIPLAALMALPVFFVLLSLAVSIEGFFKEGVSKNENRTISLYYTKFFTRHEICVFTHNVKYRVFQHIFNVKNKNSNLRVDMPYGYDLRVRGIEIERAMSLPFFR